MMDLVLLAVAVAGTLACAVAYGVTGRRVDPGQPRPGWGCCGCGAVVADVVSLLPLPDGPMAGQPCHETYCWDCVPTFHPGAPFRVFPGRERSGGVA